MNEVPGWPDQPPGVAASTVLPALEFPLQLLGAASHTEACGGGLVDIKVQGVKGRGLVVSNPVSVVH